MVKLNILVLYQYFGVYQYFSIVSHIGWFGCYRQAYFSRQLGLSTSTYKVLVCIKSRLLILTHKEVRYKEDSLKLRVETQHYWLPLAAGYWLLATGY